MKSILEKKTRLSTVINTAILGVAAAVPLAQAGEKNQAEVSAGPEGEVVWDMAFRAIDTNDNNSVEWSEIERHYNNRLNELGWSEQQVFSRFDQTDDGKLNESEYSSFISAAKDALAGDTQLHEQAASNQQTKSSQKNPQRNKADQSKKQDPQQFAIEQAEQASNGGLSADRLMGMDVMGKKGEEIGSVENLLINDQGQIVAVIAQVGGFLDIGDTHVAIPWKEVKQKKDGLRIPVTEKNVSDYSLFKREYFSKWDVGEINTVDDDLNTGPSIWKATDLINDYVMLENDVGYGYISDLSFDKSGALQSVVVSASNPTYGYGYYAYPWYGFGANYGWDVGLNYYTLPYTEQDLVGL